MTTPPLMPTSSIVVNDDYITDLDFNNAPRQDEIEDYDGFFIEEELESDYVNPKRALTSNAAPQSLLTPDQAMIERHMKVMFGYCEGYVPLRSFGEGTDSSTHFARVWALNDGDLTQTAYHFAQGATRNRAACYVIPGTVKEKNQARAADIYQMQTVLVDLDHGDIDAKRKYLTRHLGIPTLVVASGGVTAEGQQKLHIYWKLKQSYCGDDLNTIARIRELIALKAGGDQHFKSLHQPIRIAGSIYHKNNTQKLVIIIEDNPHEHELVELLEAANDMPYMEGEEPAPSQTPEGGNSKAAKFSIDELMTKIIRENGVDGITRFGASSQIMGHWLRLVHDGKLSMEEGIKRIMGHNEACLRPPRPYEDVTSDIDRLWKKHIAKYGPPKPFKPSTNESTEVLYLPQRWLSDCYGDIPPLQHYLVHATFPMRSVSILAAMGDTGKGMLTLDLALKVATDEPFETRDIIPPSSAFGQPIHQAGRAVIFTAEDDKDEIHRRLARLDPARSYLKNPNRLMVVPLPSAGGPFPLVQQGPQGPVESSHYTVIRKALLEIPDLKLVVFDPLSSFVHADTNADTGAGSFATGLLAELAYETGAAVIICHHMRKPSQGKPITTIEQARDAIRGTSALVDGVRTAYALWPADEDHQALAFKSLNQTPRRNAVFWGAVVKANSQADRTLRTYLRNDQGLLEDVTDRLKPIHEKEDNLKDMLLSAIAKAAENGHPFTHTGGSGIYKQRHRLPASLRHLSRHRLETLAQELLNERPIKLTKGIAPGSTEPKWLDVPEGKFAQGKGIFKRGAGEGALT